MLRALVTKRMLGGLALAVVFAVVCILLGRWQWGRYEDKQIRAASITAHYGATPVPLSGVVDRLPLSEEDEWLRVTTTGRYASSQQLFVRNRALDGTAGLEVLVPLDLAGPLVDQRVLVDRGWVPNADSAAKLPSVPAAPGGDVAVQGWLRRGEVELGKQLPAGQLASINVADAQAQVGGTVLDTYLVLDSEQTSSGMPPRPAPLERPDTDLGPHQAYAFQWWLTAAFGFVLLGYRARVAAQDASELQEQPDGRESFDRPVPTPRPRTVRIWDEEDG